MGAGPWAAGICLLAFLGGGGCGSGAPGHPDGDAGGGDLGHGPQDVAEPPPDAPPELPEAGPTRHPPFTAMSFNVRTGLSWDGADSWQYREDMVRRFLEGESPHLLGLQEALIFQVLAVQEALPHHAWAGVGRNNTDLDEFCAVFWDTDRFDLLESGTFWLSDTPDEPCTRFGASQKYLRIVTWARLRDRVADREVAFFNTHFDLVEENAIPERSAALVVEQIAAIAGDAGAVLTGDFNALPGEAAHGILVGRVTWDGVTGNLVDPWTELQLPEEGTFHGFTGVAEADRRIDWVLHSPGLRAIEAAVLHYNEDGHYPSDHFPVRALLEHVPVRPR